MVWTILFHPTARNELAKVPADMRAQFERIKTLIEAVGLTRVPRKMVDHIEGSIWEFRLRGSDGIARALYCRDEQRIIVVRVFIKKTQKTPRHEIKLALDRAKEVL